MFEILCWLEPFAPQLIGGYKEDTLLLQSFNDIQAGRCVERHKLALRERLQIHPTNLLHNLFPASYKCLPMISAKLPTVHVSLQTWASRCAVATKAS